VASISPPRHSVYRENHANPHETRFITEDPIERVEVGRFSFAHGSLEGGSHVRGLRAYGVPVAILENPEAM